MLVGGAYALAEHTGIMTRPVKDLDLIVRPRDLRDVLETLRGVGASTSVPHPHWLAKARRHPNFIDVIFGSGNGEILVDELWFRHARTGVLLGEPVRFCPPEEGIWMRSFVMERERFDGADVAHLIHAYGPRLDWRRLLWRFRRNSNWKVLLAQIALFDFVFPGEPGHVPDAIVQELVRRWSEERTSPSRLQEAGVCQGTLLSRSQYEHDVEHLGYADARVAPRGRLSAARARSWSRAASDDR